MALQQTLTSQFSINTKERQVGFSFFFALVTGTLLGSISFTNVNSAFGHYTVRALQVVMFFVFGNMYISFRRSFLDLQPGKKSLNHILTFSISLFITLGTLYFFFRKDVLIMAFSNCAAFVLPFFLKLCWIFFTRIPAKEFKVWFPGEVIPGRATVSLDSLLVRLKITQHVSDIDEKIYTVFIPPHIRLGDFFSSLLTERNKNVASSIEDKDAKGNKYAWEFFTSVFYGLLLRRLDPGSTMDENTLKKDAVLYIKRLIQPVKLSSYN